MKKGGEGEKKEEEQGEEQGEGKEEEEKKEGIKDVKLKSGAFYVRNVKRVR